MVLYVDRLLTCNKDVFICLCLSVVKDEREMPSPVSWKVFTPVESRQGRGSSVFELVSRAFPSLWPVHRGGFIFIVCLTLWCFCFLPINSTRMTFDDSKDIVNSVCLSRGQNVSFSSFTSNPLVASQIHFFLCAHLICFLNTHALWSMSSVWFEGLPFALEEPGMTIFFKYSTKWKSDDSTWEQWTVKHYLWFCGFFLKVQLRGKSQSSITSPALLQDYSWNDNNTLMSHVEVLLEEPWQKSNNDTTRQGLMIFLKALINWRQWDSERLCFFKI